MFSKGKAMATIDSGERFFSALQEWIKKEKVRSVKCLPLFSTMQPGQINLEYNTVRYLLPALRQTTSHTILMVMEQNFSYQFFFNFHFR